VTQCSAAEILPTVPPKRRIPANASSRHVTDGGNLCIRCCENMNLEVTLQILRQKKRGNQYT